LSGTLDAPPSPGDKRQRSAAEPEAPMVGVRCRVALLALLGICGPLGLCERAEAQQTGPAPPPPAVTVIRVERRDVTPVTSFTGRIEAVDKVDLRARVEGFVQEIRFEDGADVGAGQLLFVMEKGPYQAKVNEDKAAIIAATGSLKLADLEVDRQTVLVQRQAVAQAKLDEALAKQAQAKGALLGSQAALEKSELDLSYTNIFSPVAGRVGRSSVSVGDLVGPSSPPLATVVSQDPIYVTFPVSVRQLLDVRRRAEASGNDPRAVKVRLRLADGSLYGETGSLDFVDVQVDPGTDTIAIRARLANPDRTLIDGALVTVLVETAQPVSALVVPQSAVQFDQAGRYVLVVDAENKIQVRRIRPGPAYGSLYAVEEGLGEGDRVVTEGIQKARPGIVVAPTEAPLPPLDALAPRR
jgi:membrane fusion protein (multidrug efflux system)